MKRVTKKLQNQIGTSLVELLATVVLLGIMGVALTAGVSTIQRTYNQIVRKANEQTLLSTTLIEMRNDIRRSVAYDSEKGYFQAKDGYWFTFRNAEGSKEKGIQMVYYMKGEGSSWQEIRAIPVVSDANGDISNVYSSFSGRVTPKEGNGENSIFVISGLKVGQIGGDNPTALESDYEVMQIAKRNGGS